MLMSAVVLVVAISGCVIKIPWLDNRSIEIPINIPDEVSIPNELLGDVTKTYDSYLVELTDEISKLPKIETDTIESFEKYHNFADNLNNLIELLNREGGVEIPKLKGTMEEYDKISKTITEYAPLINNYNEVIETAGTFDLNDSSAVNFYIASGKMGLESTIIYYTVWSGPAYKATGYIYRISGLNRIAFKCPSCVSIILGKVHWFIRGYMVEKSSDIAESIITSLYNYTN